MMPFDDALPADQSIPVTDQERRLYRSLLAYVRQRHRLGEKALAALLGCSPNDLLRLAQVGWPRRDHRFASDVARIAVQAHARYGALRGLYQEAMGLPPTRIYQGWRQAGDWHVIADGQALPCTGYHADSFAWGAEWSACSELALSLLRDHFRERYVTASYLLERKGWARLPECIEWEAPFAQRFVAGWEMQTPWQLSDVQIDAWLIQQSLTRVAYGEAWPCSREGMVPGAKTLERS